MCRRRSLCRPVQGTFETVFLNEVFGDYMGIVAQVGLVRGDVRHDAPLSGRSCPQPRSGRRASP